MLNFRTTLKRLLRVVIGWRSLKICIPVQMLRYGFQPGPLTDRSLCMYAMFCANFRSKRVKFAQI